MLHVNEDHEPMAYKEFFESIRELAQGVAVILTFEHEEWCPTLKTKVGNDCRCEPEIRLTTAEEIDD